MKSASESLMFTYREFIGIVCLLPVAIAVVFSSPIMQEDTIMDSAMDALAWVCFILYVTFRLWAILFVGGRKEREVQTQGPYSLTRNPLYFGGFCFALSTAAFFKSLSLLAAAILAAGVYSRWVIAAEEQVLKETFADAFREYARTTPRLLPRFAHYHTPASVEVNLRALKGEARHVWLASLMPFFAEVLTHLRTAVWWPHWFILP